MNPDYVSWHWIVTCLAIVALWALVCLAIVAAHHRIKSGQWRPYTDQQLKNRPL